MGDFDSVEAHKQLRYMLENPRFTQREMARRIGIKHGAKISNFVRWLEDNKHVIKTIDSKTGKPIYEIPSRSSLLAFYSKFRNMQEESAGTYKIGPDPKKTMQYLSDNGGIMCLTSALGFYDDYARDPELHVYIEKPSLLDDIQSQEQGNVMVNTYWYKYPDDSRIEDRVKVTSPTRTVMDLYANNMAYLAERLTRRLW